MQSREIRQGFLKFFEDHGHRIVPSSPLVPADDPTLLFTNAGMNQFKHVFLGKEHRDYRRATSSQKCMRVSGKHNDLENVGPSLRHHTFFEMLGNFSFGDYFKAEAIDFAWRVLTDVWGLPAERLHATVFRGEQGIPRDDEAYGFWQRVLPGERIAALGMADNFWQMGDTGPCGRCSEIHFHRPELPCPFEVCRGIECDCDRFVEIWNNVFMEFDRQPDGTLSPLPAPSIDTGMGLERITAVIQDKLSNYDTDLFQPLLAAIGEQTGRRYSEGEAAGASMRVIADHIRATTFLVGDGVVPSNEWRGYVLRKIMRRAMRHGKKLGATEPFLYRLVDVLVAEMGDAYPDLRTHRDDIARVVRLEEERFDAVLTAGAPRLDALMAEVQAAASRSGGAPAATGAVLPGDRVFQLYDSFGVPYDFMEDIASSAGLAIDREGFDRAMEAQRNRARGASAFEARRIEEFTYRDEDSRRSLLQLGDRFEGYTATRLQGLPIAALFDGSRTQVASLPEGAAGFVVLPRTPFYLESGGQVSDEGVILSEATGARARVEGMARLAQGAPRAHRVTVERGTVGEGDIVTVAVDAGRRDATRRNHTATHLLHAALRQVLGPHVKQAGSLVAPDRLRFDFVHFAPLTREELESIERLVNTEVYLNVPVVTEEKATEEAMAAGAMALFGEKYGERVRVVSVPHFSMELCGGTHCRATGDIGLFTIVSEGGVAAGVRRIEALTGALAVDAHIHRSRVLDRLVHLLGTSADQAALAVERLQQEVRRLGREASDLRLKAAMGSGQSRDEVLEAGGVKMIARRVPGMDKDSLRALSDSLRDSLKSGVVVLASDHEGKVSLVVSVSKDLTPKVHAGQIVKRIAPIVGGGGGGRPDFAEAGGRDVSRIDALLAESRTAVEEMAGG
jgi:alanyl-tRNA synthetase